MKWIKFVSSLVISYVLGFTLSRGLSATNTLKYKNEVLEHELPFIYTVRLNEMLIILIITILISLVLHVYYEKSQSSQKEIFKLFCGILWIECIIFSLVLGTWQEKILSFEKNGFLYKYSFLIILIFVCILIMFFSLKKEKSVSNEKKEDDLFESRKTLLIMLEFYLKNSKGFSIIGDWGIGKTKLVKNFFEISTNRIGEKYGKYYEFVYIDVSTFSDNKKIVQEIEEQINLILKKNRILKLETEFLQILFNETSIWFKNLKNIIFEKNYLEDSKSSLHEKIKDLKKNIKKEIVICLDNLERITKRERIINLLSVVDDITSDDIKKIYIYDKKHMEFIFKKVNFDNYIEKYSENFIKVEKSSPREIIKNSEIIDLTILRLGLRCTQELENEDLRDELTLKLQEIEKITTNPRKIINLKKIIDNKNIEFSNETKIEYIILKNLFGKFDYNNLVQRNIFFPKWTYEYRVKFEEFEALEQGKLKLENPKTREEVELKEKKALNGNADEILQYIDYCKKNKIVDKIQPFLNKIQEYKIMSFSILESFLELYLHDNIDIGLKKMKVILKKDFFSGTNTYEYGEREKIVKTILILYSFSEVRKFIKYLYNENSHNELKELFKSKLNEFEENLKKLKNLKAYDLKTFIDFLSKKSKSMDENQKKEIFNYIDKSLFEKQMKILIELRYFPEVGLDNKEIKKIKNLLETLVLNNIEYNEIFTEEEKEIQLYFSPFGINETINNENLKDYKFILENMIENHKILKELYFQIFLLEKRLKNN